jgi:hypothetical protein
MWRAPITRSSRRGVGGELHQIADGNTCTTAQGGLVAGGESLGLVSRRKIKRVANMVKTFPISEATWGVATQFEKRVWLKAARGCLLNVSTFGCLAQRGSRALYIVLV